MSGAILINKKSKNLQKPLDKQGNVCYNMYVIKRSESEENKMFSANDARANVAAYRENLAKSWQTEAETWVEEVSKSIDEVSKEGAVTYRATCANLCSEVRVRACKILNDLGFTTSFENGEFYRITW